MTKLKMTESQKFIFISKYAKWLDSENRREINWEETATRYLDFMKSQHQEVPAKIWKLLETQIVSLGVVPSMRAVQMAGPCLDRNHLTGYNCSYIPFDSIKAIADALYILMAGTGVGFSVESLYTNSDKMPVVEKWQGAGAGVYVVQDDAEGWADSLYVGLNAWFSGKDIEFDYSIIRPRGARLKTKGGRASGPGPLRRLHDFCRETINKAQGRKLTTVEMHDIGCVIADVIVSGGVRRSALISFSDLNDKGMRDAKVWPFPAPRSNANNTAVFNTKPTAVEFLGEWGALAASGTGERGIFNVTAVKNRIPKRREYTTEFRTNPCGEILLRPRQLCNLSEVIVRPEDSFDDLIEKVKAATWIGCIQAKMTKFPYVDPEFKKNCEEERLLGVSLTGIMDNPKLLTEEKLEILKKYAVKEAKKASSVLGINMPAAVTCTKPSGTVSQLANCGSGAHAWHSQHYFRRYRLNATDPLFRMMKDQGVEFAPENGQGPEAVLERRKKLAEAGRSEDEVKILEPDWTPESVTTWVCSFPVAAPKGAVLRESMTAIDQLEHYKKLLLNWAEHNISITVSVKDEEWVEVGAWVYKNFDDLVAVSFLPYSGGHYTLAPYEACTKEQYEAALKSFPTLDYTELAKYELEDNTTGAQSLACTGSGCES